MRPSAHVDLLACCAVLAAACLAAIALPAGAVARLALDAALVLVSAGYRLVEAAAGPARDRRARAVRALLAVGFSPALVGLVALATAFLPGGFRAGPIVLLVGLVCAGLAVAAF